MLVAPGWPWCPAVGTASVSSVTSACTRATGWRRCRGRPARQRPPSRATPLAPGPESCPHSVAGSADHLRQLRLRQTHDVFAARSGGSLQQPAQRRRKAHRYRCSSHLKTHGLGLPHAGDGVSQQRCQQVVLVHKSKKVRGRNNVHHAGLSRNHRGRAWLGVQNRELTQQFTGPPHGQQRSFPARARQSHESGARIEQDHMRPGITLT